MPWHIGNVSCSKTSKDNDFNPPVGNLFCQNKQNNNKKLILHRFHVWLMSETPQPKCHLFLLTGGEITEALSPQQIRLQITIMIIITSES